MQGSLCDRGPISIFRCSGGGGRYAGAMDGADFAGGWVIVARVDGRRIALPAASVRAILPIPPLWRPPTLPLALAGFMARGGRAVPVLDAARLLGLAASPRPDFYAHILLLPDTGAGETGLLVDRADETREIAASALMPVDPADTLHGCATALAELEGEPVHVLAATRLLAAGETAALAALTEQADRRLAEWAPA